MCPSQAVATRPVLECQSEQSRHHLVRMRGTQPHSNITGMVWFYYCTSNAIIQLVPHVPGVAHATLKGG